MYKIFAPTLFVGQRLVFVPECPSTNTLAMEMAAKTNLPEGTVVATTHQTGGRGQRGNVWHVAAGMNLTFSILLKPVFLPLKNQFCLTMVTSLALIDYLRAENMEAKIKWPNDILVGQKKICGILIENSVQRESIQLSIVGIGLNINQTDFDLPSATSLALIGKKSFDLNLVMNTLLGKFEQRYLQLRAGKTDELKKEYLENLFGRGEQRTFISNEKKFDGTIEDVSETGELVVQVNDERRSYRLKEISFIL